MISDYFPMLRAHADKLAVIRSCHADSHAHGSALVQMNTGMPLIGRPSLGAWVAYGLGSENDSLPAYVVMLDKRGGPISGQPNWSSGFMPASFQGALFRPVGSPVLDLEGPAHLDREAQRRQLDVLAELNQQHLEARPGGSELAARIQSYELAYRMQAEVPEAVDLATETAGTREAYGIGKDPTDEFGRNCLVARRLIERGVRFVQLYSGGGHLEETWDAHESIEKNHGQHAAEVDQPIAALLADLEQRGMLEETLVVWGGEFGRKPFSEGKDAPGRNHNPYGFSMWMAGGGVKGGIAHGETDEFGFEAVVDRVHVHDIHATILHLLGIDHELLTYFHQGRDESLTDVYGKVVEGILE
jgi:membrane-anchored protein YejM (alkaline phosphatase superfamily)